MLSPHPGASVERGSLRAGAARVDIAPPANHGYPPSRKYAREPLYIRAAVLDSGLMRAALIGADQSGLGKEVIRGMTNATIMSGNVAIWGAQKILTCPGRQHTNTGKEVPQELIATASRLTCGWELPGWTISRWLQLMPRFALTYRGNSGYVPHDAAFGAYTSQVLGWRLRADCAEQGNANGLADMIKNDSPLRN